MFFKILEQISFFIKHSLTTDSNTHYVLLKCEDYCLHVVGERSILLFIPLEHHSLWYPHHMEPCLEK